MTKWYMEDGTKRSATTGETEAEEIARWSTPEGVARTEALLAAHDEAKRAANADATGSMKPTNPKDAIGSVKCPLSTVPSPFLQALGVAMLEGSLKYGRHNYRPAGVRASVYFDAMVNRHAIPWWEGEDLDPDTYDPDTGLALHHLIKAAACIAVIYDSIVMGNSIDDRPVRNKNFRKHFDEMNLLSKGLIKKYPEPKEPFTEIPNVLRRPPDA